MIVSVIKISLLSKNRQDKVEGKVEGIFFNFR